VVAAARSCARLLPHRRRAATAVVVAATVVCLAWPARRAIRITRAFAAPSTEVAALDWVLENIPDGAAIAYEPYTAPLQARRAGAKSFELLATVSLSERTLESYQSDGWQYLLASSAIIPRYTSMATRQPKEAAFYHRLWRVGIVLHRVGPESGRRGPVVTVFRLPPATGGG
jgi:hypothetical protein